MTSHRAIRIQLLTALLLYAGWTAAWQKPSGDIQTKGQSAKPAVVGEEKDDPIARRRWMRSRFGDPRLYAVRRLREALKQQALYPMQVPGALKKAGAQVKSGAGMPAWVSLGPTTAAFETNGVTLNVVDSGRLSAILPHPTDPNTVYVAAAGGGLWMTTNFLQSPPTWTPLTDSLPTTAVGAAAFGSTPLTIYLGLGDPFDNNVLVGGAMVKSIDGGVSWSAPFKLNSNFIGTAVRDVKVQTGSPDIVLAAADVGLFRSADGGVSYSAIAPTTTFKNKGVWSLVKTSAGWLASTEDNSLTGAFFISTDNGVTWNAINNAGGVIAGIGRATLAVGTPGDSVVYAFAANAGDSDQFDLFRSTNGGQDWTALGLPGKTPANPIGPPNNDQPDMDLMHGQAGYNQLLLVDPTDTNHNTVYIGGNLCSAKSTDGGSTWTLISDWLPRPGITLPYSHADFHTSAFSNLSGTKTLFFGNDGGLFVSTDGGTTWNDKKNIGLVTDLHYSIASNPTQPDSTITGLQDLGTRVRENATSVFDQTIGGDGLGVGSGQANALVTLGSIYFDAILSSDDLGVDPTHWISANSGINTGDAGFFTELTTPNLSTDATGKVFFTTGVHNIYKTTDGAMNWVSIGSSGSGGISSTTQIKNLVHSVGVSPLDTNHIGVTAVAGILLITFNGGTNWTEVNLPAQVANYNGGNGSVAWVNNSIVYECSESMQPNSVHVVKSIDGGMNWTAANNGLPDTSVSKLQVDPNDATGNTLYAASFLGVYRTTNGGASWSLFGTGLPAVHVTDMYMPANGNFLRISTYGRGIWEINTASSPATHFSVVAPANATAGTAFNITVTALDAANATATGYSGTTHFTSTDGVATLPADSTLTNGVGTFPVTLKTAGSQTVTATDTVTASITGASGNIALTAGAATHFLVQAPGAANAGSIFTITVTAQDVGNNTVTGYSGMVHFTSTDGVAILPGNSTLTSGVGTFPVTLKTAGSQSLTATDTFTASITGGSNSIAVAAGAATHYSLSAPPSASVNFPFSVTVTAQDTFNNTATGYAGTVHFTSTGAAATLPGNHTFTMGAGNDNGVHVFNNGFTATAGAGTNLNLTATDTVIGTITGGAAVMVVSDLPLTAQGRTLRISSGRIPLVVASFIDADPAPVLGNFSATISWGDASTSPGTIVQTGPQSFNVLGAHDYSKKGKYTVTVMIMDSGGSTATATSQASFLPRSFSF